MATSGEIRQQIAAGQWDSRLKALYGPEDLMRQRTRWCAALKEFEIYYGPGRQVRLFTAPGRTELGGNHTDHQHGYGLAAAVTLDLVAVAAPNDDGYIRVKSRGFNKLDVIDLSEPAPQKGESTHSASLVRGIAEGFRAAGRLVGGFDAYTASDVLRGSGLSSSAAFEMGIAVILNELYNCAMPPPALARICQYAENIYFGKPSGLLDQLTSAVGGVIFADFSAPDAPLIEKLHIQGLLPQGIHLCVTDTCGSHSELTGEFAAIRREMETVAACLGATRLAQVPESRFWAELPALRSRCGDRAVLRAMHFYEENARVLAQCEALRGGTFEYFLKLVRDSGHASFELCQNVYCTSSPREQGLSVALALSQKLLERCGGAWRMQGGGFAGTIQAFVPTEALAGYREAMEAVFGPGSCHVLCLREQGAEEALRL
ncbi:MAG: galactokinase [Faecalibacterium sp.]